MARKTLFLYRLKLLKFPIGGACQVIVTNLFDGVALNVKGGKIWLTAPNISNFRFGNLFVWVRDRGIPKTYFFVGFWLW